MMVHAKSLLKNSQLPISRLPYEIFADIFVLSQLASDHGGQSHTLRQEEVISHVSHSWREHALDMAPLWTRIEVQRPKRHDVYTVASYLQLSKAMSIDIVIGRCLDGDLNRMLWDLITPELVRCRKLSVDLISDFGQELKTCQALSDGFSNVITSLNITSSFSHKDPNNRMRIFGGGAPLLTHLALYWKAPHTILPPLLSVTTLALDLGSRRHSGRLSDDLKALLQAMPQLSHLRLDNIGNNFGPAPHIPFNLATVQTLFLDAISWDNALSFLTTLSMPQLQELTVNSDIASDGIYIGGHSNLMSHGPTRFPLLERLRGLSGADILSAMGLLTLFCAFPRVNEIHLVRSTWGEALTDWMCGGSLRTIGIEHLPLNDKSLESLDRGVFRSIECLSISPELFEDAREYATASTLPFVAKIISKFTPFPLAALDRPAHLDHD